MEFTTKTFNISENASFSVLMTYFDGHPICQTKSLKLMYHGQLQEMKSGSRLYESLINHGLFTQEALNLLNYLSRLIYGENVYDVYINNSNQCDYVSEMKEYITHSQPVRSDRLNNRFDLIDEILFDDGHINVEELNKHRNEDFPLVVHNFNEIEVAPLFTYVHSNLTINRGETVHLCHFAFLLERLSHLSAYPEFNNQAIMSLLGNAFESEESGLTVEEITKDKYEEIVEENNKLRKENKKKQDKLDKIIKQNKQLQETIDELYNMNLGSTQDVSHLRRDVGYLTQDIHDVSNAIAEVNERVGILSINNQKLNTVHDVFIIYFSESKPSDIDKRNDCEDDEIWLSTYNGQLSNYKRNVPKDAYLLYQIDSNRLDSFKFITENPTIEEYILDIYQRNIKIYMANFHRFIDEIDRLMNADGKYEAVRNLQVLSERIKNNERHHQEHDSETERKRQILERYNDLHINVNRYKRKIYAKLSENSYRPVNEVNDAYNFEWFYRYGHNGSKSGVISTLLLNQDIFTNEHDTRIRYE